MNADQIAAELRRGPSLERLVELQRECQPARLAAAARLAEIRRPTSPAIPCGRARQLAIEQGVDAVVALDREAERLEIEISMLDDVEARCTSAMEASRASAARAAAPGAHRKLRAAIAAASAAATGLDKALAALGELVKPISEAASLPGAQFPLEDSELVELLQLRNRVWNLATVPALYPPTGSDILSAVMELGIDPNSLAGLAPSQQREAIEEKLSRVSHALGREGLRTRIFGRGFYLNAALGLWEVTGFPLVPSIELRGPPGSRRRH